MRLFQLNRKEDVTGVSGAGVVARGIYWPEKDMAAFKWLTDPGSIVIWPAPFAMEKIARVHGHDGRTAVEWVEDAAAEADLIDEFFGIGNLVLDLVHAALR